MLYIYMKKTFQRKLKTKKTTKRRKNFQKYLEAIRLKSIC